MHDFGPEGVQLRAEEFLILFAPKRARWIPAPHPHLRETGGFQACQLLQPRWQEKRMGPHWGNGGSHLAEEHTLGRNLFSEFFQALHPEAQNLELVVVCNIRILRHAAPKSGHVRNCPVGRLTAGGLQCHAHH